MAGELPKQPSAVAAPAAGVLPRVGPDDLRDAFADHPDLVQQANESTRAYRAFVDYCQMGGGRSLHTLERKYLRQRSGEDAEVAAPPTVHRRTLEGWSTDNKWQDRVRAYEATRARIQRSLEANSLVVMRERHATIALAMLNVAIDRINLMTGDELSVSELRQYITEAVRLEREARSVPSNEIEVTARMPAGSGIRVITVVKDHGSLDVPDDDDDHDEGAPDEGE